MKDQLNDLIRSRRSIYPDTYTDERIADEIVWQILENANWAPTHARTEPWRFKVLTGEALARLGDFLATTYRATTSEANFSAKKYEKMLANPRRSSHVVAICMQRDPQARVPEIEETNAVACAVQNMWLTTTAYGIGAYWSTPPMVYGEPMRQFLQLEAGETCLGLFYMGYHRLPAMQGKRTPIQTKVAWIAQ